MIGPFHLFKVPWKMSESSSTKELSVFHKKYRYGNVLGEGNFSVVRECLNNENSQFKFAVKVVRLKGNREKKEEVRKMMQREVQVMKRIDNENIIKYIDAFFGNEEILLVIEGTKAGDLYDHIINTKDVDEEKVRNVAMDISSAIQYLHRMQIVHRDIKPENFLLFQLPNGKDIVKLCDFGLAIDARQLITEVCGSPSYVAPEVLRMENYGLPVDIWSCGVVYYIMLCHFPPFYADGTRKLFQKIIKGSYDFPSPYWDAISENAKDLVSKMLVLNIGERIKAKEMASHPWLSEVKRTGNDQHSGTNKPNSMTLRSVAIAVRCAHRFAEPILKPTRERAILSSSFLEGCRSDS